MEFQELLESYVIRGVPTTVKNPQSNGASHIYPYMECRMLKSSFTAAFDYGDHSRYIVLYLIILDKFELLSHTQIYTNTYKYIQIYTNTYKYIQI